MAKGKKREDPDNVVIYRYLNKQDGGSGEECRLEKEEISLASLKGFLTEEFQKINMELRYI